MVTIRNLNTVEEYNKFIESGNRVVKFSAEWCSPCKMLGNIIRNLDIDKIGEVEFAEIDVDNEAFDSLTSELEIRSIPVTLFLKNGEVFYERVGLMQADEIYYKLNELFN